MAIFLSPSVITREIDISDYPASVSASIAAMVGTAVKGPVNRPVYITSPEQLIRTYGNPSVNSYLGYAALAYLEKGNQLYVNRVGAVVGTDKLSKASASFVDGSHAAIMASITGPYTIPADYVIRIIANGGAEQKIYLDSGLQTADQIATEINRQARGFYADSSAGTLRLTSTARGALSLIEIVDIDNSIFNFPTLTQATDTGSQVETFNISSSNNILYVKINEVNYVTVSLTTGAARTAAQVATDIDTALAPFGASAIDASGRVQVFTEHYGSGTSLEFMTVSNSAYSVLGINVGAVTGTSVIPAGIDGAVTLFTVTAINEGTWGNNVNVAVTGKVDISDITLPVELFDISVYDNGALVESWQNLKRGAANATDPNYIETIINDTTASSGSTYITIADVSTASGNPRDVVATASAGKLAGGKDGIIGVTDADYIGVAYDTVLGTPTGLQVFANPEKININILLTPGVSSTAVIGEMLQICETRADAMCLIDTPYGMNPQEVVDWHNGVSTGTAINSSYGAIYYDWIQIYDSYNAVKIYVPPSGYMAGVYAYNDFVSDPWWAPAGLNRGRILTALGVKYSPNKGERDLLYGNGNAINPIVNFITDGVTVWGQRTAQRKASALDRVNVRRLLLYVRKVAANLSRFFVFEPDDPATWKRVKYSLEPLFSDVQSRRGIVDYKVICDSTINTPARVDRNELWVRILLKPTKAAEFIQLDFVILPQGANLEAEVLV